MKTHLYRHFDKNGALLYVGISLSALNRLGQHCDHSAWYNSISRVEIETFEARELALEAEAKAIFNEKPKHNIMQPRKRNIMSEIARRNAEQYEIKRSEMSKEELTGRVVKFDIFYTYSEVASVLGISRQTLLKLIEAKKIGKIVLPARDGLSAHGTPFKPKEVISGWQLISYLESLHNAPI